MRVLTAALVTETNTSSPIPTGWQAFEQYGIQRGREGLKPSFVSELLLMWQDLARADGHEIVHSVAACASPAGVTVQSVYEALRDEIVEEARTQGPFDVVLLALHGAMVANEYDDCEGDLLQRLRDTLGPVPKIGAVLDLHCHVTEAMIQNSDVLIAFKEYPHTDILDRAREVYRITMDARYGRIDPVPALHDCRMVGLYFTQDEPMRSFVGQMMAQEGKDGIVSVSLAHGFPWGDVKDNGTKVLVYADGNRQKAAAVAKRFGDEFWRLRKEVSFDGIALDEAIDRIDRAPRGLIVVADVADNSGGGAPGDSTFLLRRILERRIRSVALGPMWDPIAVGFCHAAGVGARLDVRIGGKCSPGSGEPLDLSVMVRQVAKELRTPAFSDQMTSYGAAALIEVEDSDVHIVLSSHRAQAFSPVLFTGLGLDLGTKKVAVVKSFNHFQARFRSIAAETLYVRGPGTLAVDMKTIPFKHRSLEYWPRVDDPFRTE